MLLRDDKADISSPNTWSLIGGQAEEGESSEEALRREIWEETNMRPKNCQLLMSNEDQTGYFVPLDAEDVRVMKLGNEGQELKFFGIEELENIRLADGLKEVFEQNKPLLAKLLQS